MTQGTVKEVWIMNRRSFLGALASALAMPKIGWPPEYEPEWDGQLFPHYAVQRREIKTEFNFEPKVYSQMVVVDSFSYEWIAHKMSRYDTIDG